MVFSYGQRSTGAGNPSLPPCAKENRTWSRRLAHFASMAIFVGGYGALVPERMRALSEIGLRALVAATLACLMTACIAGMFFTDQSLLFGK